MSFNIEVAAGNERWRRFMLRARAASEKPVYLNPTIARGGPDDTFALFAVDAINPGEREVAAIAMRIMEGSLPDLVYSGAYFGQEDTPPATLPLPAAFSVAGKIGVMGGLYVWPEYEGNGLGPALARECRQEGFRRGCDYVGGYMLEHLVNLDPPMWERYEHQMCSPHPVIEDFVFQGKRLGPLYLTLGGPS